MYPGQVPMPSRTALTGGAMAALGQTGPAGRPARTQPIILSPANVPTGFAMNAAAPEAVQAAQQKFIKSQQLPPALRPKSLDIMEQRRHAAITRGWQRNTNSPFSRSLNP